MAVHRGFDPNRHNVNYLLEQVHSHIRFESGSGKRGQFFVYLRNLLCQSVNFTRESFLWFGFAWHLEGSFCNKC